ncbi:sugar ABC transporter ATP-binding protein [Lichenibacterium ramalinae]|uniref:Sugar ABC transporter ATP-binding protein n=1 Tax=Lichenibacterium ramalinae TaxID=2316527 RepID=A0A4V1RIS6_9HYPH|nr:sugar ABC transporter ATP-binding protein [Lichenibacterium ramalinae]RYB05312.1 sugar ABC transporter ATP-binding protein [Lichenibacterium ramalinae]
MGEVLALKNISKAFVGVQALSDIDFSLLGGEVHALLGENGAGKSTLMKILAGITRPDGGEIVIDGVPRRFQSAEEAAKAGVGIVFQEFSLIPDLDAVDNIFLGREKRGRFGLLDRTSMRRAAAGIIARLNVELDLSVPIGRLSVAQQQFVEIAKALSQDARILILDEPTATLTHTEAEHLFRVMRDLRRQGVGMIFISHHLEEIFEICDRITVLRDGRYIGTVPVAGTTTDALIQMMVGRRIENSYPPKPAGSGPGRVVLRVSDLQLEKDGPVNAFELREGEILGFSGLVGSGRTETALGVIGALPCQRKRIEIDGRATTVTDPADALRQGIGILPESRKADGLIIPFAIRDNISINNLGKYRARLGLIDGGKEVASTAEVIRRVGVKAPSMETRVETLSGGNQQKVVIARWLNHHTRILIFDEPTRGIDVGAKADIYVLMRALTARGYAIVMISSELPEIVGMCDRVAVFRSGKLVNTLERDAIDPETIMKWATQERTDELV